MAYEALSPALFHKNFSDALEFLDNTIQERQTRIITPWRTLIPRGVYTLGEGLVKKSKRYFPGHGDWHGMAKWRPIQVSRVGAGNDPGVNACATQPYLLHDGAETVSYTGLKTERKTDPICINDVKWLWEFKQQLTLKMGFLADVAIDVWANYSREQYIKMAVDAGNAFVLAGGNPRQYTFDYDPFSEDADGDSIITIDRGIPVSALDWNPMRFFSRYLGAQASQAALGTGPSGRPQFGLVMDRDDFDQMIEDDPALREDFRYQSPDILISNYGTVQSFKNFSLMDDQTAPRFRVKSITSTKLTLKRIDPLVDSAATDYGYRTDMNPEYLEAEYAMGIILMKDVFKIEIPPSGPSAPGGGTYFGATPGLNGQFAWINIPDRKENYLGEIGEYFARFEAFAKPLAYADDAIVFIYKRCPAIISKACVVPDTAAATATLVHIASATAFAYVAGSSILADITLAQVIPVEAGDEVTVTDDNAATSTAIVAESSNAPSYRLVWVAGARPTEANMNDVAVAGVTPA
jgi:hypothetical protein